jgi:hypothetical protein
MTAYICARCGRDLRLVAHKISETGERYCLGCPPDDEEEGPGGCASLERSSGTPPH